MKNRTTTTGLSLLFCAAWNLLFVLSIQAQTEPVYRGKTIRIIAGFAADIRLAVENGEVDGVCMDWNSIRSTWRKALETEDVIVIARITPSSDPEIAKIPLAADFAKTPEGRRLIQVAVQDRGSIFRPYLLP